METGLIVREEYWDRVIATYEEIRGIALNDSQRKILIDWLERTASIVQDCVEKIVEISALFIKNMSNTLMNLSDALQKLREIFDDLDLSDCNYDEAIDRIERRCFKLRADRFIRESRYYHSCFKIMKLNHCIKQKRQL